MDHKAYLSQRWGRWALALLNFKFLGPELNPTAAQAIKHKHLPALPDSQHMHCRAATSCTSSLGDLCSPWISRPEPKPGQILSVTGQIWDLCVTETSEMCVSSTSFLRGDNKPSPLQRTGRANLSQSPNSGVGKDEHPHTLTSHPWHNQEVSWEQGGSAEGKAHNQSGLSKQLSVMTHNPNPSASDPKENISLWEGPCSAGIGKHLGIKL